jgi:hypothetical protein
MIRSRPHHHLRHQWSQISTFVSLNHIHHHIYFKSSYVHIQVFHILHHHTMKLLQAFESFLSWRPIIEIGSENWLAAGRTVRQQKLVRCRLCTSTAKNSSLQAAQFSSENCFAASTTISVANATSLQPTRFRQRMLIHYRQLNSGSESQIHYKQYNFDNESQFHCRTHNSTVNVNSLQTTQFQQRIPNPLQNTQFGNEFQIRCRPYNFDSKSQICCGTHNLAVNVNSLQTT